MDEELQNYNSLISSIEMSNIEIALEIAKSHKISIDIEEINKAYQFAYGVKDELLNRSSINKKILALNLYSKATLKLKEDTINLKFLKHFRNLKEMSIKIQTCAPQFIIQLMEGIVNLKSIEKLNLVNYRLSYLPQSIGDLQNLEVLVLKGALLKELPEDIGKLRSLKKIELTNSSLKTLPKSISTMKNLEEVNIKGTKIRLDELKVPSRCIIIQ